MVFVLAWKLLTGDGVERVPRDVLASDVLDTDQLWHSIRLMSCGETSSPGQHDLAVESSVKHKGFFFNRFQQLLHEISHGPRLRGYVHSMIQAAEDIMQRLDNRPQMSMQDKSQIQAVEDLAQDLDNGSQMSPSDMQEQSRMSRRSDEVGESQSPIFR